MGKFFPFRVDTFSEMASCTKEPNRKSNIAESLYNKSSTLKTLIRCPQKVLFPKYGLSYGTPIVFYLWVSSVCSNNLCFTDLKDLASECFFVLCQEQNQKSKMLLSACKKGTIEVGYLLEREKND